MLSAMWRKEWQGRGAIHFHLICFNMPYWKQAAIQKCWEECTGESTSIVYVKLLRNKRQAMYYVSKYIAKEPETDGQASLDNVPYPNDTQEHSTGRHWGYIQAKRLPYAKIVRVVLLDTNVADYLRFAMRSLARFRTAKGGGTLTLYHEDCYLMIQRALDLGGFVAESNDFDDWAVYLTGSLPYAHLRATYRAARPYVDWKAVTDLAYKRLEQEFLTKQRLTASMSWIDRRR